jgi:hypothetical protein
MVLSKSGQYYFGVNVKNVEASSVENVVGPAIKEEIQLGIMFAQNVALHQKMLGKCSMEVNRLNKW